MRVFFLAAACVTTSMFLVSCFVPEEPIDWSQEIDQQSDFLPEVVVGGNSAIVAWADGSSRGRGSIELIGDTQSRTVATYVNHRGLGASRSGDLIVFGSSGAAERAPAGVFLHRVADETTKPIHVSGFRTPFVVNRAWPSFFISDERVIWLGEALDANEDLRDLLIQTSPDTESTLLVALGWIQNAALNAEGTKVAVAGRSEEGPNSLYLVDLEPATAAPIWASGDVQHVAWMGTDIYFEAKDNETRSTRTRDAAAVIRRDRLDPGAIYRLSTATGEAQRLTIDLDGQQPGRLVPMPSKNSLVVTGWRDSRTGPIVASNQWLVDLGTGARRNLTPGANTAELASPSPSGRYLAIGERLQIAVHDLASNAVTHLAQAGTFAQGSLPQGLTWMSAHSERFLYFSNADSEGSPARLSLWEFDPSTGERRIIRERPATRPGPR